MFVRDLFVYVIQEVRFSEFTISLAAWKFGTSRKVAKKKVCKKMFEFVFGKSRQRKG